MSRASTFFTSTNGGASSTGTGAHDASGGAYERSYFEQQREGLMREVGSSMESVLQNINKLNRSLEGIISVGNEFSSVEALWSHFENVMAKDGSSGTEGAGAEEGGVAEGEAEAAR